MSHLLNLAHYTVTLILAQRKAKKKDRISCQGLLTPTQLLEKSLKTDAWRSKRFNCSSLLQY